MRPDVLWRHSPKGEEEEKSTQSTTEYKRGEDSSHRQQSRMAFNPTW